MLRLWPSIVRQSTEDEKSLQRSQAPWSSMVSTLRKNSRSFLASLLAGISMPRMEARTRIKGLRPHHLPRRVSVCPLLALRYL